MELDPIFFSDGHAALVWSIQCSLKQSSENQSINNHPNKFKWSNESKDNFVCSICSINTNELLNIHEQLDSLQRNQIDQSQLANSINGITDSIADIFSQAALNSLKQTKRPYKRRHFDKPWRM